jgi:hypothetical protein
VFEFIMDDDMDDDDGDDVLEPLDYRWMWPELGRVKPR